MPDAAIRRRFETVELYIGDEKDVVRYTAAASALRLIASKEAKPEARKTRKQRTVK